MPLIIAKSISILSDAGLGMAMFSLGQYHTLLLSLLLLSLKLTIHSFFTILLAKRSFDSLLLLFHY
jgi:hypothetical protein